MVSWADKVKTPFRGKLLERLPKIRASLLNCRLWCLNAKLEARSVCSAGFKGSSPRPLRRKRIVTKPKDSWRKTDKPKAKVTPSSRQRRGYRMCLHKAILTENVVKSSQYLDSELRFLIIHHTRLLRHLSPNTLFAGQRLPTHRWAGKDSLVSRISVFAVFVCFGACSIVGTLLYCVLRFS